MGQIQGDFGFGEGLLGTHRPRAQPQGSGCARSIRKSCVSACWGFLPGCRLRCWAEGPPIWNVFLLPGLVLPVWAASSRLGCNPLSRLVAFCGFLGLLFELGPHLDFIFSIFSLLKLSLSRYRSDQFGYRVIVIEVADLDSDIELSLSKRGQVIESPSLNIASLNIVEAVSGQNIRKSARNFREPLKTHFNRTSTPQRLIRTPQQLSKRHQRWQGCLSYSVV